MNRSAYQSFSEKINLSSEASARILACVLLENERVPAQASKRKHLPALAAAACLALVCALAAFALPYFAIAPPIAATTAKPTTSAAPTTTAPPATSDWPIDSLSPSANQERNNTGAVVYRTFHADQPSDSIEKGIIAFTLGNKSYVQLQDIPNGVAPPLDTADILQEHFGKALGKVKNTDCAAIKDAKIFRYTPVKGTQLLLVQKSENCALFMFAGFDAAPCKLQEVFDIFGIASPADVAQIKISTVTEKIVNDVSTQEKSLQQTLSGSADIAEFLRKSGAAYKNKGFEHTVFSTDAWKDFELVLRDGSVISFSFYPREKMILGYNVQMKLPQESADYLLNLIEVK